jgi:hypothetical protein
MQDPNPSSDLKAHLQSVHAGLAETNHVDPELRSLLTQLDGDIHTLLQRREAEAAAGVHTGEEPTHTYGMAERAQELTARFAARHPRLEPALRQLSTMLSNMGI